MKAIIMFFIFASLLFGQESTTINSITISSSFNDFNAVYASVDITIEYASAYARAKYIAQYWDGDSWENAHEEVFWEPQPPVNNEDYVEDEDILGIALYGDGNFRVKFYSYADGATDEDGYHNFSVTDVTAPSAPTISKVAVNNYGDHPKITWSKPSIDTEEYDIYRKVNGGSYTLTLPQR
jgi:hypothetical protein